MYSHFTLIVYSVHRTVYTVQCPLYAVKCTLYTGQCTLYNVHYTLYTVHYTLYTVHCTVYTVHYTLYTGHYTLYRYYSVISKYTIIAYQFQKYPFTNIIIYCPSISHKNNIGLTNLTKCLHVVGPVGTVGLWVRGSVKWVHNVYYLIISIGLINLCCMREKCERKCEKRCD